MKLKDLFTISSSQNVGGQQHLEHLTTEFSLNILIEFAEFTANNIMFQQDCIPVGCVTPTHWSYLGREGRVCQGGACWGVFTQGGACLEGCLPGECLPRGCLPRGCTMWPIPSCIWCYLYAAFSPTETHQQCSCLCSAGFSCDLQGMLGYHPPTPWTEW